MELANHSLDGVLNLFGQWFILARSKCHGNFSFDMRTSNADDFMSNTVQWATCQANRKNKLISKNKRKSMQWFGYEIVIKFRFHIDGVIETNEQMQKRSMASSTKAIDNEQPNLACRQSFFQQPKCSATAKVSPRFTSRQRTLHDIPPAHMHHIHFHIWKTVVL